LEARSLALKQLHDEQRWLVAGLHEIQDLDDVRMFDRTGGLRFDRQRRHGSERPLAELLVREMADVVEHEPSRGTYGETAGWAARSESNSSSTRVAAVQPVALL
jgi:hypothetical protein